MDRIPPGSPDGIRSISFDKVRLDLWSGLGLLAKNLRIADDPRFAAKYQISRKDQDTFALESHQRAVRAHEAGFLKDEDWEIATPTCCHRQ